jgi:hypothetical protein
MSDFPETALAESLARQRYYQLPLPGALPLVMVAIDVTLHRVLSLRDRGVRRRLDVTVSEMIGEDWRATNAGGKEVLSQTLSRVAFMVGVEGLILPSAARRRGFNLLWFPDHLDAGSSVIIIKGE